MQVLSLCVPSNCHGNRESCNWIPSNWEGKFTINLCNIIGPSSPLSFPSLSPPSQPERPTRWGHQVGWVLLPWQLVCRWVQADDTTVSPRLPPSPPPSPLSLPLFFCFTTSLFSSFLPPLSCLVLFYLSLSLPTISFHTIDVGRVWAAVNLHCIFVFALPTFPLPSLLSLSLPTFSILCFTHDQCRKSLGCCQPALLFCLPQKLEQMELAGEVIVDCYM